MIARPRSSITLELQFLVVFITLLCLPSYLFAWPTNNQWIPIYKNNALLQDQNNDAQGSRNIVSAPTRGALYIFNDGTYIYFRLRLDKNPQGTGGQQNLESFGWGVEFDTNLNASNYEWLIMVDGISKEENITLLQNTVQGTLGDPGDKAEIIYSSIPLVGNYLINVASSSFNEDQDYFLDWRFPYSALKQATNLSDYSPIRLFCGSSSSTWALTESGADLCAASDLYAGFSDYLIPLGTRPATGTVKFVAGLSGAGDVVEVKSGNTLYIRVDDADQNYDLTAAQSLTVTLSAPSGESETVTLTETGPNTGVFTGSISSLSGTKVIGDSKLQVMPGETVTVTYLDKIDANLNSNQTRTDTLLISPPVVTIAKTANPITTLPGGIITYTITITNSGDGDGWLNSLQDSLPVGFSYITGTTTGLTTNNPVIDSRLTWTGNWIVPRKDDGVNGNLTLSFQAKTGSIRGANYNTASAGGSNFGPVASGNTATVTVTAPFITILKEVDRAYSNPGTELIYSMHYRNQGDGEARTLIIMDTVPLYTSYVPGSLRMGNADSIYGTATPKTDSQGDDEAEIHEENIVFKINLVAPDDGVPNSGNDEGKVYFKVKIH